MASAIMDGLVSKGTVTGPDKICCSDLYPPSVEKKIEQGYFASLKNSDVCERENDAIILAVKPNYVVDVCKDIIAANSDSLVISVAAGITLATLESYLPGKRVVRVMPNTACLVGESASGYAMGSLTNDNDKAIVQLIFGSVGLAIEQKEDLLNAVTGVSGSGPAYVFLFMEALADAGVRVGLSRADATKLAAQCVKGAAEMVLTTGSSPAVLKDQVCSPGGTTIAGVDALEQGGFRTATINAVKAATRRSYQLAGNSEETIANKYNL